jgi:hypothetical protein
MTVSQATSVGGLFSFQTIRCNVVNWPIASFRRDAKVDRYRGIADHSRTCRWLSPVANDPERAFVALLVISKTALHKPIW